MPEDWIRTADLCCRSDSSANQATTTGPWFDNLIGKKINRCRENKVMREIFDPNRCADAKLIAGCPSNERFVINHLLNDH